MWPYHARRTHRRYVLYTAWRLSPASRETRRQTGISLAGDQTAVTEILGLDTVSLPGGAYEMTAADALAAEDSPSTNAPRPGQRLDIVRGLHAPAPRRPPSDDKRSPARAYDAENSLASRSTARPMVNDRRSTLLFKAATLDIQLAADPPPTPAHEPAAGLALVTRQGGSPAVVYRPKVRASANTVRSPPPARTFDAIEWPTVTRLRKTGAGFTATVSLPLARLGWTPKPGDTVKLDLGCLFGNPTGSIVASRAYWQNNSFSANVTNDIPTESRLEPAEWGTASVE